MSLKMFGLILLGVSISAYATCPNCTCVLATTPVNFGESYNPLTGNVDDTVGSVTATCTSLTAIVNASFSLALNTGANSMFNPRSLESGNNILNYNLYTDGSFTQVWGDGTNGTSTVSFAGCSSTEHVAPYSCSHTFTIYGKIPASQKNVVGHQTYINTITASFTY
jgi:spore coat protein U-like protein